MTKELEEGDKAPDFSLPASNGEKVALSDFKGKWVVLYFYPKDDTPGCTIEACQFRDEKPHFTKKNAVVLGVSKDSVQSHEKFINQYALNFLLLSDEEAKVCTEYGVFKQKNFLGKKFMGIERSTFLINPEGLIQKIWRSVKAKGHDQEILKEF